MVSVVTWTLACLVWEAVLLRPGNTTGGFGEMVVLTGYIHAW